MTESQSTMRRWRACVVIPTYNNHATLRQVVTRVLPYALDIIVVNDGSTDGTPALLADLASELGQTAAGADAPPDDPASAGDTLNQSPADPAWTNDGGDAPPADDGSDGAGRERHVLTVVSYADNRGKGHALRVGLRRARQMGFDHAITLDSDGQHYPEDIPCLIGRLERWRTQGETAPLLVVGSRGLRHDDMPGGNTLANYFSNFWFALQTWQYLPDTQSGYRLYPLGHLHGLSLLTARYEAELELLVFAAWHGVRLVPEAVRVYYPPRGERVTHFRPVSDFMRISVLNTVLCALSLCYGWWVMLARRLATALGHALRRRH